MVYTVFYKTSSFAGYCFLNKNSIHPKRRDVFNFKHFEVTLVKFQICSFIVIQKKLTDFPSKQKSLAINCKTSKTGVERIELPLKVLETSVIPLDQTPLIFISFIS